MAKDDKPKPKKDAPPKPEVPDWKNPGGTNGGKVTKVDPPAE